MINEVVVNHHYEIIIEYLSKQNKARVENNLYSIIKFRDFYVLKDKPVIQNYETLQRYHKTVKSSGAVHGTWSPTRGKALPAQIPEFN